MPRGHAKLITLKYSVSIVTVYAYYNANIKFEEHYYITLTITLLYNVKKTSAKISKFSIIDISILKFGMLI